MSITDMILRQKKNEYVFGYETDFQTYFETCVLYSYVANWRDETLKVTSDWDFIC